MRRTFLTTALIAVAGLSSTALADGRVTVTDASNAYNGSNGSGGAFTVTRYSPPDANGDYNGVYGGNRVSGDGRGTGDDSFLTFCVEENEFLSFGGVYYTEISTSALNGGVSGGNPDPLSGTTAKLASQFRSIADSGTTVVDPSSAFGGLLGTTLEDTETTAIQEAIWYSEGEIGSISGTALLLYNWAAANNDGGLHGIRVLRLWTNWDSVNGYSGNSQDLLTCIPLPPAGWAGLGSLAGVLGFSLIRNRRLHAA